MKGLSHVFLMGAICFSSATDAIRWEPGSEDRRTNKWDLMVTDPITTDSCNMTAKGLFVFQSFALINLTRAQYDGTGKRQAIDATVADQNIMMNPQFTYGITEKWEIDAIPFPIVINDNSREIDGPRVGMGDASAWSRYLLYEQTHEAKWLPSLLFFSMLKVPSGIVDLSDQTGRRTFGNLMTEAYIGSNVMWEFRPVVINLNLWYVATFGRFFHAPSGTIRQNPGDMIEMNASIEWVVRDYKDDSSVLFAEINQVYQGRFKLGNNRDIDSPIVYSLQATIGFAEFIDRNTFLIVSLSATLYGMNAYQNWGPYISAGKTFQFTNSP
ncbi:MAG: hypothetical protein OHK0011_04320 [Turneriella sp.]